MKCRELSKLHRIPRHLAQLQGYKLAIGWCEIVHRDV